MMRRVIGAYGEAFSGLSRTVWLLSLVTLIHRSGTMVLPFLTLYLTIDRGLSVAVAGTYLGLYGLGGVLGALAGGWLDERVGSKWAMASTLMAASAGFFALSRAESTHMIALVLFATSVAAEGFRTPSSAALARATTVDVRTRAFGLRRLAINLGMSAGPAIGGLLATVDYGWLFIADAATCLAAGLVVLMLPAITWQPSASESTPETEAAQSASMPEPSSWLDRGMIAILVGTVLLNLGFFQLFATYTLSLRRDLGYSEAWIGLLLASNTILIVAFEMVLLARVSRVEPRRLLVFGALAQAVGFLLVPFGAHLAMAFVAIAILTVAEMLTHPVVEGLVATRAPRAALGRAMGVLTACFSIVFVVAPLVGTWVYQAYGHHVLWASCTTISLLAAVVFAAARPGRPQPIS